MKKWTIRLIFFGVFSFLMLNILAYNHAKSMMTFSDKQTRTLAPEKLTFFQKITVLVLGIEINRPENLRVPSDIGLSFTNITIKNKHNELLHLWDVKAAPKINNNQNKIQSNKLAIAFHGYAVGKDSLLENAKGFSDLGIDSLLVDFYGSAQSSSTDTTMGLKEADDVIAVIAFAKQAWPEKEIILYGVSMGGSALLKALSENEIDVDFIILEAVFDSLLNTTKMRFYAMGLPAFPAAHCLVFWGGFQADQNTFGHNPVSYAQKINSPVLLLQGDSDLRVSLEQGNRLLNGFSGKKYLSIYDNLGHQNIAQAQFEKWKNDVGNFLVE